MPLILSGNVASATTAAYSVDNSCRFNDDDTAYMAKTMSAGDTQKYTFSTWVKRGNLGGYQGLLNCRISEATRGHVYFHSNNSFAIYLKQSGEGFLISTNARYRDSSAWYHVCVGVDSTQSTEANRVKIYVNGTQVTSFENESYPDLNEDSATFNVNTQSLEVGRLVYGDPTILYNYFDGYMAETVFIDGTQYAASDFGEFDSSSPTIWKPKDVSELTFGTNGFYLDYEASDNLGNDANGGTDLTESNLDATDQTTDTPTNNFATWNPLIDHYPTYSSTLSNGNLSTTRDDNGGSLATIMPSQGKWYMEAKCGTVAIYNRLGVVPYDKITDNEFNPDNKGVSYQSDGDKVVDSTASAYGSTYTTGDIIGIALNLDDGEITFYKNGVAQNSGTSITGFTYDGANSLNVGGSGSTWSWDCNFGNAPYAITSGNADADGYGNFEYAVPSGYYALCTKNLAEYG